MGLFEYSNAGPDDVVEVTFDKATGSRMLLWLCPGCKPHPYHMVPVKLKDEPDKVTPTWNWNGSVTRPTLSPSIRHVGIFKKGDCHYFMREGSLQFCTDSYHELAGQTVPMAKIKKVEDGKES